MAGTPDDKRAASNITAALSSYLMTAGLGVIAAEAVIGTFVLDKREDLGWFYVLSAVGVASSVASIYFGGRGIFDLTKRGFDGDWAIKTGSGYFNRQACSALFGVLFVAVSAFCGNSKAEARRQEVEVLKASISELRESLNDQESKYQSLSNRLDEQVGRNREAAGETIKKPKE